MGRNGNSEHAEPPQPKKVELRKGQKVSLVKKGGTLGEIVINLNWSQPAQKSGFFGRFLNRGIDLDLACLFELNDGSIGAIQALGNHFGELDYPPYIALDGDDRTGAVAEGETIRVNGKFTDKIRRILVYTFIYEGAANWEEAKGVVTVNCPGSPELIVRMDEYGSRKRTCASTTRSKWIVPSIGACVGRSAERIKSWALTTGRITNLSAGH